MYTHNCNQTPQRTAAGHTPRRTCLAAALFVLLSAGWFAAPCDAGADVSVAISDNVVILDSLCRSGVIELVNLGDEPTEFRLSVDESLVGTPTDASTMLRWAPRRALVPAHQTRPVRIAARPTPQLPPGEYVFRVGVTAEVKPVARKRRAGNFGEIEVPPDAIAVTIPIVPTLPVTVYLRHEITPPMIDIQPLVLTPDDERVMGYFPVRKRNPEYSFVGQVQVVEAASGELINSGRLHLKPGNPGSRVNMPRAKVPLKAGSRYCVLVWDHFPGEGEPTALSCGQ